MKRNIIYSLFTAFLLFSPFNINISKAEQRVIERLYISTDRGAYIAGEALWLSVYCFDISKNTDILSDLSNVAYIELHNSNGVVITAKIALNGGRGSGRLELPLTLPTGNYRLIGYTKQMLNEDKVVYFDKVISIYNTLSSDRVPGNVEVREEMKVEEAIESKPENSINLPDKNMIAINFGEKGMTFPANSSFPFAIKNNSNKSITFNISVVKIDSIPAPAFPLLSDYLYQYKSKVNNITFTDRYTPEYEGEIIKGKINYEGADIITDRTAFLSAANGVSDVYTSFIDSLGNIAFYTNSIFGDRDIVLEIPKTDTNSKITFEIFDPFLKPVVLPIPKLFLSRKIEESLNQRSESMQIEKRFRSDTLYEKILLKRDPLLKIKPVVYLLDDYTRFTLMQEVVVEFISELRFRKIEGNTDLQVRWENSYRGLIYSRDNTLVLIDGVPVFNHKKVFDYDPLKVRSLSVYGSEFYLGVASFSGIVSFQTYKGNYPGLTFNKNVRIIDYHGVQYPSKFTANELVSEGKIPNLRSTLFWDPNINLLSGESKNLECYTPVNPGTFELSIEGIDKGGSSFLYKTKFVVR